MTHKFSMPNVVKTFVVSSLLGFSLANVAYAADALTVNLQAKQVVTENGKQTLKTVSRANKGDIIQYQATYRNNLQKPMTGVAITIPVPTSMTYLNANAPAPVQASLDGKSFENLPIMRKVNGKLVEIPSSQYRAVRWIIKTLPAQQSATVSVNTQVR